MLKNLLLFFYCGDNKVIKSLGGKIVICPRCKSERINVQAVNHIKSKGKGCIYWLFIGWWLEMIMWIFFTLPWLVIKIIKPKNYSQKMSKQAVCQNCGHSWRVR